MKTIDGLSLQEAILYMAIATFVEKGFEKTSMDEVAARAGTTKRTVYAHFGNKEALFRAALGRAVNRFQADLPKLGDTADPARELENFAARFSELCTWLGAVRLQRVVMGEAERFPDLGGMMHSAVIGRAETSVAAYLETLRATRRPDRAGDADWALIMARLFLNMATGPQRFESLLEARALPPHHPNLGKGDPDLDRAHIRQAVALFLAGSGLETD